MKTLKFIPLLLLFVLVSCSSVRVNSDYDKNASFDSYKTYAYHKNGIDKVEIPKKENKLTSINSMLDGVTDGDGVGILGCGEEALQYTDMLKAL